MALFERENAAAILPLTQKLLGGFFWSFLGTGARVLTLAGFMVTARLLGKETYGEIGMIQSTILFLGTFTGFGLGMTTTRHVAALKESEPERTGRIIALTNSVAIILGTMMTTFCLGAAPWLAEKTLNAPNLVPELRMAAILLLLTALLGVQAGTLSGLQNFKALAKITIYQGLIFFPLSVVLILIWQLKGAVLALVGQTLVGVLLSSRIISRECAARGIPVNFRLAWLEKNILWSFSLPAFLAASMVAPVSWAVRLILVHQENGYAEMGLFNAAFQIAQVLTFIPLVTSQVTIPFFSEIHDSTDTHYFVKAMNHNVRSIWAIGLIFNFIIIGSAPYIMLLFGRTFLEGETVLTVLTCSTVISVIANTLKQGFISSGKVWINFSMNLYWALLILPAAYFLTPSHGAYGLALANLVSYVGLGIVFLSYCIIKYGRQLFEGLAPLIFLTIMAISLSLSTTYLSPILVYLSTGILLLITICYSWYLVPLQIKLVLKNFLRKNLSDA